MASHKELYLVWQDGKDDQFYNQYFNLEDAVSFEGNGAVIFKAKLENLGSFELVVKKTVKKLKKGV